MYKRCYVFLTVISLLFATWTFPSFAETSSQEEQLDFDLEAEQNIKSINEAAPDLLDNKVIDKNEENNEENNGEAEIVVLNEQTALHSEGENVENNEENPGGNPEEEPIAVEENGYFLYKEDFSAGPYGGYGTTFDGVSEVPADKKLWLLNPNGGEIIYQNPNGVTWKISENPEYCAETSHGWVGFYKEGQGNAMTITGYGSWYKSLAVFDLGENIKIKDIADGDKQHINFSLKAASRMHAVALYVNDDSKSYILIGSANGEDTADYGQKTHYGNKTNYKGSFVTFIRKGVPDEQRVYFSNDSVADEDKRNFESGNVIDWDITIEDEKIYWKAVSGGKVWEGSSELPKQEMEDAKYIAGFYGMGDPDAARLYNFQYESRPYYDPRIGEPKETIYHCAAIGRTAPMGAEALSDESIGTYYKMTKPAVIRRAKVNRMASFADRKFYLSEGGETPSSEWVWDEFEVDDDGKWINMQNSKQYRYFRTPTPKNSRAQFYLLENIENAPAITIRKGSFVDIYRYYNGEEKPYAAVCDDDTIAEPDADGYSFNGIKDGKTKAVIKGDDKDFAIDITVEGEYSDLIKRQDVETPEYRETVDSYLALQNGVLATLNNAISANDKDAVQTFFTSKDTATGVNGLDGISLSAFAKKENGIYHLLSLMMLCLNIGDMKPFGI